MPEIVIPKASVLMEYELDTQLITPSKIKLKLKPLMKKDTMAFAASLSKLTKMTDTKGKKYDLDPEKITEFIQANMDFILDFIIGWDLEKGNKPIPVTKENKKKWLEPLLWENVRTEEEEKDNEEDEDEKESRFLGFVIAKFCADMKNFTKN